MPRLLYAGQRFGALRIEPQRFREQLDRGLVVARIELDASPAVRHARRHAGHVAAEQGHSQRGDERSTVRGHPFTSQLSAHIPASTAAVASAKDGCAYAEPTNNAAYIRMKNAGRNG